MTIIDFVDQHHEQYGVEPICSLLPIAPSTYYEEKACQKDPTRRSDRFCRDEYLKVQIKRVWKDNFEVYGARKVWRQLNRERIFVARCTVERIMRSMGLQGALRGKKYRTTVSDSAAEHPLDLVNRNFTAWWPNQLWVADFTYVATWSGVVYVAFIIDVFSRFIVGWRVARSMTAQLTLDALEQALWARKVTEGLIHHSDKGSQYLAIRYSERLVDEGIKPSVGSTGDSYDNALAESIIGLFKTEVIRRQGPWKNIDSVECATLEWVDWFNNRRLLEPIGNIPPAEYEEMYYTGLEAPAMIAGLK